MSRVLVGGERGEGGGRGERQRAGLRTDAPRRRRVRRRWGDTEGGDKRGRHQIIFGHDFD